MGLRDLTVAPSSLFAVHAPLVEHIRNGVVTRIFTVYMVGPVADAVSQGLLATPVVIQTLGGRARAIESGQLHIDIAFIAAPAADDYGNRVANLREQGGVAVGHGVPKQTPRGHAAFGTNRLALAAQRSMVSATPMPPPMHRDAIPFLAFWRFISCSSVTRMRQPDAPIG